MSTKPVVMDPAIAALLSRTPRPSVDTIPTPSSAMIPLQPTPPLPPFIQRQNDAALQALTAPPMPQAMPSSPMQPLPMPTQPNVTQAPPSPQSAQVQGSQNEVLGAQNRLRYLQNSGSGIDQITHPVDAQGNPTGQPVSGLRRFGGVLARIGEGVETALTPGFAAATPGTTLHNQELQGIQQGKINEGLANQQSEAGTQQEQAQTQNTSAQLPILQNQAAAGQLANQGTQMGLTREQNAGTIVRDGYGRPIGWQDVKGITHAPGDPAIPPGVAATMPLDPGKAPTSAFELWLRQNPGKTAQDYQTEVVEKPISNQEASSLNAVWDGIAQKHGLPSGQFKPGMPHGDAQQLESALNSSIGKQQGDTHVNISLSHLDLDRQKFNQTNGVDLTDPATASAVAAVARGDLKLTDIYGRGASMAQKAAFVSAVKQMNPNYNSGDHDIENKVRQDFTSGVDSNMLTSINRAREHMGVFLTLAKAMDNGNVQALNQLGNAFGTQFGNDRATNLNIAKQAFSAEVGKAFAGASVAEGDRTELQKSISTSSSFQQLAGAAHTADTLLAGAQKVLKQKYDQGVQGQANFGNEGAGGSTKPDFVFVPGRGLVKQ